VLKQDWKSVFFGAHWHSKGFLHATSCRSLLHWRDPTSLLCLGSLLHNVPGHARWVPPIGTMTTRSCNLSPPAGTMTMTLPVMKIVYPRRKNDPHHEGWVPPKKQWPPPVWVDDPTETMTPVHGSGAPP
jgi:hypothetical protein